MYDDITHHQSMPEGLLTTSLYNTSIMTLLVTSLCHTCTMTLLASSLCHTCPKVLLSASLHRYLKYYSPLVYVTHVL